MTNTTNEKVGHTPGPWQQGRLLMTRDVLKWSPVAISDGQHFESRCVFSGFTTEDEGKSRKLVAICERPEDATHIAAYPSLTAERDTLKALCVEYKSALEKIAAYNDTAAWKQQRQHSSYTHFDEPQSVEIAHTTLTRARSILK